MLSYIVILFALYCSAFFTEVNANPKKVLCSYDDERCLSESTKAIYPIIVAGRPGEVESSDPLYFDKMRLKMPNLEYVLKNATMSGMQNCTVMDVVVTAEKSFFNYYIWCPSLIIESNYEAIGQLEDTPVKGKGTSKVVHNNYNIWLKGYYDKLIDAEGDLHTQVTNFVLELRADEVTLDYTGLCFGENQCADNPSEKKLKRLEAKIQEPLMHKFLEKYINNLNTFLRIVPIKDIHYELVEE